MILVGQVQWLPPNKTMNSEILKHASALLQHTSKFRLWQRLAKRGEPENRNLFEGWLNLKKQQWPEWWDWELELCPHLLKRMMDRQFNEIDLKKMLNHARSYRQDIVDGRWVIMTRHSQCPWEVIVEPDSFSNLLVVITAYPVWEE